MHNFSLSTWRVCVCWGCRVCCMSCPKGPDLNGVLPCSCQDVSGFDLFPTPSNPGCLWREPSISLEKKMCARHTSKNSVKWFYMAVPHRWHPQLLGRSGNLGPRRLTCKKWGWNTSISFKCPSCFSGKSYKVVQVQTKTTTKNGTKTSHVLSKHVWDSPHPFVLLAKKELLSRRNGGQVTGIRRWCRCLLSGKPWRCRHVMTVRLVLLELGKRQGEKTGELKIVQFLYEKLCIQLIKIALMI